MQGLPHRTPKNHRLRAQPCIANPTPSPVPSPIIPRNVIPSVSSQCLLWPQPQTTPKIQESVRTCIEETRLYKVEVHPLKGQKTYHKPKNFHFIKGHHPRASNLFILAQIVCSIGCACYFVEMDPESMSIHFYDSSSQISIL